MVEKLKAVERNRPASSTELLAVQEGIKVLETLVALGEEQNSKCFLISVLFMNLSVKHRFRSSAFPKK